MSPLATAPPPVFGLSDLTRTLLIFHIYNQGVQPYGITNAFEQLYRGIIGALPDILTGIVFLRLGAIAIKVVMVVVRAVLASVLPGEASVYRQFIAVIILAFLWFAV